MHVLFAEVGVGVFRSVMFNQGMRLSWQNIGCWPRHA